MAEEIIYDYNKKYNWTDPSVRISRELPYTTIGKPYQPGHDSNPEYTGINTYDALTVSMPRIDGIYIPVVKINGYTCKPEDISSLKMSSVGFTPTLTLVINDYSKRIRMLNNPGMSCVITVVITMPIDGVYKKISCDFYSYLITYSDTKITYSCKYYCPVLERRLCCSWTNDAGKHPTTYELMEKLAKMTGLGFAATEKVKDVLDNRPAVARSQTVSDVIRQHTSFGGTDKSSIFDSWIDFYGYIVLVNIQYIMSESIDSYKLMSHHLVGSTFVNPTDYPEETQENRLMYTDLLPRVITNYKYIGDVTDITFTDMDSIVNNVSLVNEGTNNIYFGISTVPGGGDNNIIKETINIVEPSLNGRNTIMNYTFDEYDFLGCEFGVDGTDTCPVLFQEKRHDMLLNGLRAKKLKVTLTKPNLGLSRGILLTVLPYEYNPLNKKTILNIIRMNSDGELDAGIDLGENVEGNPMIGIPDVTKMGVYYIDGVEFSYSDETRRIDQILFLVKKDGYHDYMDQLLDKFGVVNE